MFNKIYFIDPYSFVSWGIKSRRGELASQIHNIQGHLSDGSNLLGTI